MRPDQWKLMKAIGAVTLWLIAYGAVAFLNASQAALFATFGLVITLYLQGELIKLEARVQALEKQLASLAGEGSQV